VKSDVSIIGAGIASMSAAAVLAQKEFNVTVFEKNDKAGGRINTFSHGDFHFDMGPSWYWMPEIFENFYQRFGYNTSDFYNLQRLDPSYKVVWKKGEVIDIPANYNELEALFENIENGSASRLRKFLDHAKYKYEVGMNEFVWKPGHSLLEFADFRVIKSVFRLQMFSSISKEVENVVRDSRLREILKFPCLFLGATPEDTPALYSLMNYADLKLGTWYPKGGMYEIAKAFYRLAQEQGVHFKFNEPVQGFKYNGNRITQVKTKNGIYDADIILAGSDYHHVDQSLLDPNYQSYSNKYWETRKMAPSSLLVFLGVSRKLEGLEHHNLFFDADFNQHAYQIYKEPKWPDNPLFYACCPSRTDDSVAPCGMENLFLLMPIAPDLKDDEEVTNQYINLMIKRIEKLLGYNFESQITFQRKFSVQDFKSVYNSFKGNAYGLANTLLQTANLKPSIKSKKIDNLYYAGQLTTPGPGLPPSIISGQIAASQIIKKYRHD